jgi:hypothetical protein
MSIWCKLQGKKFFHILGTHLNDTQHNDTLYNVMSSVFVQRVFMLCVSALNVFLLSASTLSVFMLSAVQLF